MTTKKEEKPQVDMKALDAITKKVLAYGPSKKKKEGKNQGCSTSVSV